jgi:DNA-binding MarR family transcriptional regulator
LSPHTEQEGTEVLLRHPEGRIIQALLDANAQHKELVRRYEESEADRAARLRLLTEADAQIRQIEARRKSIEEVLVKMDASYKLQMSHGLARLLRRLQSPLKMDDLYKAMEERIASNSMADGANAAPES